MVLSMHVYAKECNVRMHVQSSLQWAQDPTADHHSTFGSAIRVLLQDEHGICDAKCMLARRSTQPRPALECFVGKVDNDASISHNSSSSSPNPTLFEGHIFACGENSTSLCDETTRDKKLPPLLVNPNYFLLFFPTPLFFSKWRKIWI